MSDFYSSEFDCGSHFGEEEPDDEPGEPTDAERQAAYEEALALEAAYAESDAWHREREAEWLAANPDADLDCEQEAYEQEARERRP